MSEYRSRIAQALGDGWRFGALYAHGGEVRTLLVSPDGATRLESVAAQDAVTIVDLVPAAGWDEREAHDLCGVPFNGHAPLRPLVDHTAPLADWTVPILGHDSYQVAVG